MVVAAVAYHVEVRRSFRRAWAFNLSAEKLRRSVVAPWVAGRSLELGDRRWEPRESELRVLEGPELSPPELAFGQGWNSAERSGRNVTRRILAELSRPAVAKVAVVAERGSATVPPELRGLDTLRLDAADPATPSLLAERLRLAAGGSPPRA